MDDADKEPIEILLDLSPDPSEDECFSDVSQDSPGSPDSFIPVKSLKRNRKGGAQPEIRPAVPTTGNVALSALGSVNSNNNPTATGAIPKANRIVVYPPEINSPMGKPSSPRNLAFPRSPNSMGKSISPENLTGNRASVPIVRVRQYPLGGGKQFVVYVRPKGENKLDRVQIAKNLEKGYRGIECIRKVNNNKMIVVVNNAEDANDIVRDPSFSQQYRVWIPAHVVEIDGVVTDDSLRLEDLEGARGHFRQPGLPSVDIIECRQMGSMEGEGEKKTFTPSASFRLTFAGSALPDYILIGKLRLAVRLFRPKVMSCANCQQLGHTMSHCSNKSKCSKCGGPHKDDICENVMEKCLHCGGNRHDLKECPKYKERSIKLKKNLIDRSRRSFADIVKTTEHNCYEVLTDESGDDQDDTFTSTEENYTHMEGKQAPKRKKSSRSAPSKRVTQTDTGNEARGSTTQPIPPSRSSPNYDKDFPETLPKSQTFPPKPHPAPASKPFASNDPSTELISLSSMIEMIIQFFEFPDPISGFIKRLLPVIQKLCFCIAAKWPLLSELINIHA